jgi:hypothetical protein
MNYQARDSKGNIYEVNGRDKNLLIKIYESIDSIASNEEWESFWKETYKVKPMDDYSNNRKFLWSLKNKKWLYTDMSKVNIYVTPDVVENFLEKGIELVKNNQKIKSKLLENLTAKEARILLEVFDCFDYI